MTRQLLCLTLGAGLVAGSAPAADYVTLTAGDARGKPSFAAAGNWSDGEAPHGDADYLVALGGETASAPLRTPANGATSITFAGRSLTIGNPETGEEGMILHKAGQTAATTWPDLRLFAGCYSQGSEYTNPRESILWGDWTVLSGVDAPFSLLGANDRFFYVGATLHGEAESVLRICHSTTETSGIFTVRLAGTNTTYNGSLVVQDAGAYLEVLGDVDVLGAPDNALPVVLTDRGGLRTETLEPVALPASKSFEVSTTRGRVFAENGQAGKIDVSFTGEGVLEKWGLGRVLLAGSLGNVGGLQVLQGELDLDDAATFAADYPVLVGGDDTFTGDGQTGCLTGSADKLKDLALRVGPDGFVAARTATETLTLAAATFAGGGVMARTDLEQGVCSLTVLEPSVKVTWPMTVALDQSFPGLAGPDAYPVLKIPAALKKVTADDFVNATPGSEIGLPRLSVVVQEDEAGDQIVSIARLGKVVEMVSNGDSSYFFATAKQWSDGVEPHAGADYLVSVTTNSKTLRTGDANLQTAVFAGDSLTFKGASASLRAYLTLKAESTTVDDLTMYGFTSVGLAGYKNRSDCTHSLYGTLHVRATSAAPLSFSLDSNRQLGLYSELEGPADAYLQLVPANANNNIHLGHFYGLNTNYFGSIYLSQRGQGTPGLAKYVGLSIACEENLGGNPPAFKFDTLTLAYYSRLDCRGDVTLDDPNRGIFFDGASQLLVEDGETLTLKSPLTFNAKVFKQGAGRLALGAPLAFGSAGTDAAPSSGKNLLEMVGGSLQALTSRALDGLCVDCTNNTVRLVVDLAAGDASLKAEGVVNTYETPFVFFDDGRLAVDLLNVTAPGRGSFTQPVLTVVSAAAETLREKLDLTASLRGYRVSLGEETLGENVRFNAVFTDVSGTAVIVR